MMEGTAWRPVPVVVDAEDATASLLAVTVIPALQHVLTAQQLQGASSFGRFVLPLEARCMFLYHYCCGPVELHAATSPPLPTL